MIRDDDGNPENTVFWWTMAASRALAETIADRLAVYLGPHTAKTAVRTFCERAFKRSPETLTLADIPSLLGALRPMLRTLIGAAQCEVVLSQINRELGL